MAKKFDKENIRAVKGECESLETLFQQRLNILEEQKRVIEKKTQELEKQKRIGPYARLDLILDCLETWGKPTNFDENDIPWERRRREHRWIAILNSEDNDEHVKTFISLMLKHIQSVDVIVKLIVTLSDMLFETVDAHMTGKVIDERPYKNTKIQTLMSVLDEFGTIYNIADFVKTL